MRRCFNHIQRITLLRVSILSVSFCQAENDFMIACKGTTPSVGHGIRQKGFIPHYLRTTHPPLSFLLFGFFLL